jgi:uncharacterized phiE125 gp8 family phage protein
LDPELLRQHCKLDHHDEDQLLFEYAEAAADYAEHCQNRILRTSTWEATYDGFPGCEWELPGPLQSVTRITYLDTGGATQTLATSVYTYSAVSGRIALKPSQSWPSTQADAIETVTVTFVAGYTSAALIPASTRQVLRLLVDHQRRMRAPIVIGASVETLPLSVQEFLSRDMLVAYR